MKSLKKLLQIRQTYIGIAAAVAFQLIFFGVWMTAYDGVNDRMNNLSIGIVNEDAVIGQEITKQINDNIPFKVQPYTSIELAKSDMNERKIDMVIQMPATLTESIESGAEAEIIYWINQSTATLAKTIMENAAFQLNEQVNQNLYLPQVSKAENQFIQKLHALSLPEELTAAIEETITFTLHSLSDRPIDVAIEKTNNVDGFASNLVPLMVIISSFVGAMVMIMQHEEAVQSIREVISKWDLFIGRQTINVGVAFLLPLLTISLMSVFQISSQLHFLTIYLFQFIMFWAFLSLAQVFVLLFGNLGMIFNILALSLQLVTSGVLVPRAMLSDWYIKIGSLLPATYGADGYYTIIFGGSSSSIKVNILSLVIIIIVTLSISIGTVFMKKQRTGETVEN